MAALLGGCGSRVAALLGGCGSWVAALLGSCGSLGGSWSWLGAGESSTGGVDVCSMDSSGDVERLKSPELLLLTSSLLFFFFFCHSIAKGGE